MPRKAKRIKADVLYDLIRDGFSNKFNDPRIVHQIKLSDMLMSSLAVFALKSPSLLHFEKLMRNENYSSNLKKLFKIGMIPSDTQLRDVLDRVDYSPYRSIFKKLFSHVQRSKLFERYEFLRINNLPYYLLSVDGTAYFRSDRIHCENCMEYEYSNDKGKNFIKYGHNMLGASFVSPSLKQVIPIYPEPIHNSDGKHKNDCELKAFKRFVANYRREHPKLNTVILLDALFANKPVIDLLENHKIKYIIAVKNTKSVVFMEVTEGLSKGKTKTIHKHSKIGQKVTKEVYERMRYSNNVRLHQDRESPYVNFLDIKSEIVWEGKRGLEFQRRNFAYITNIFITDENIEKLAKAGRSRWKIENETFNTLKNRGYHFEHNYGHGEMYLSYHFILNMFLAFFVDQVQELSCESFKKLRSEFSLRMTFEKVRAAIEFAELVNWENLYVLLIEGLAPSNTS